MQEQNCQIMTKYLKMTIDILSGIHGCSDSILYGDWRITKDNTFVRLNKLNHLLTEDKLKLINFKDIAWKGMSLDLSMRRDNCICCHGKRFLNCNTDYPCIVCRFTGDIPNPFGKKYRMLDGKHRIDKMLCQGITKSLFYVLDLNDIIPYTELRK